LFRHGQTFTDILNIIINEYENHRSLLNINPGIFSEYENVRSKIAYKLISYAQNKNLLKDIPHIPFLDLAIVFYCLVAKAEAGNATFLINNHHLSLWNVTVKELHDQAVFNTPFLLAPQYTELEHIFKDFITDADHSMLETEFPSSLPVYVLTNSNKLNGAACMLYDDLLKDISEKTQSDFYIIPSSVHEVILVAVHSDSSRDIFTAMVREVNQNEVAPDEVLSDHVYFYDRMKNEICF